LYDKLGLAVPPEHKRKAVERCYRTLELDAVRQKGRDRHLVLAQMLQNRVLKRMGSIRKRIIHPWCAGCCARRSRTAMDLARRLNRHPLVARVYYPGLPDHPGHEVAARQMTGGFGGMMSLGVKGGERAAIATAAAVRV
jgi:hypothetical protein